MRRALTMGALCVALVGCDIRSQPAPPATSSSVLPPPSPAAAPAPTVGDPVPDYARGCMTLRDVASSDVVRVDGKTLYYLDAATGLRIVDLTDVAAPRLRGHVDDVGTPLRLFVRDELAWVVYIDWDPRAPLHATAASTVIRVIDVHDADHPRLLGETARDGVAFDAQLVGGLLYLLHDGDRKGSVIESFGVRHGALARLDGRAIEGHGVEVAPSSAGLATIASRDDGVGVTWFDLPVDALGQLARRADVVVPGGLPERVEGGSRAAVADEGYEVHVVTCDTAACSPKEGSRLYDVDVAQALPHVTEGMRLTARGGFPVTRFDGARLFVAARGAASAEDSELTAVALYPKPIAGLPLRIPGAVESLTVRSPQRLLAAVREVTPSEHRILVEDIDVRGAAPKLRGTVSFGSSFVWSNASEHAGTLSFDPAAQIVAIPYSAFDDGDRHEETGAQLVELGARGPRLGETILGSGPVERAVFYEDRWLLVGRDGVRSVPYRGVELENGSP